MTSVQIHMPSRANGPATIDFRNPVDREHARLIGRAWIDLRRGASTAALRTYLFSGDAPLVQGQMDALDLLERRDERTMKGLAARLRVDPSTATRAVQRLVDDGLAERFPSPEDGRVVLIRITDEGRRQHSDVAARRSHAMMRILDEFDADERAQLTELLNRFITSIDSVVAELVDEHSEVPNISETA